MVPLFDTVATFLLEDEYDTFFSSLALVGDLIGTFVLSDTNKVIVFFCSLIFDAAARTYSIKVKKIKGVSTKKVVYSSSKKSIAKVSSKGKVTALKEGTATITVKSAVNKKVKAKFNVTVKKKDNTETDGSLYPHAEQTLSTIL